MALFAALARLFGALVIAVTSILLGFGAFMGWLVTCSGGEFYEGACDRSGNPLRWLAFLATVGVIVAVAGTLLYLIFGPSEEVSQGDPSFDDETSSVI